jgi:hypothetical protein
MPIHYHYISEKKNLYRDLSFRGIAILIVAFSSLMIAPAVSYSQSNSTDEADYLSLGITEVELSSEDGSQWIEIYNPTNRTVSAGGIIIRPSDSEFPNYMISSANFMPGEYRVIELWDKQTREELDGGFVTNNSTITLWISNQEVDRTPPLTDNLEDSRTWQLDGDKWVFEEETPTRAIPEFSGLIMFLILLPIIFGIYFTNKMKTSNSSI